MIKQKYEVRIIDKKLRYYMFADICFALNYFDTQKEIAVNMKQNTIIQLYEYSQHLNKQILVKDLFVCFDADNKYKEVWERSDI